MGLRADDSGLERMQQHQDRRAHELVQRLVEIFYKKKKPNTNDKLSLTKNLPSKLTPMKNPSYPNHASPTTNPHQLQVLPYNKPPQTYPHQWNPNLVNPHQQQPHTNDNSSLTTNLLGQNHPNDKTFRKQIQTNYKTSSDKPIPTNTPNVTNPAQKHLRLDICIAHLNCDSSFTNKTAIFHLYCFS